MEIDITRYFTTTEHGDISASVAELGQNAAAITWNNAKREAEASPLLKTEEELQAFRDHAAGFGAWPREDIAAWDVTECNALLAQMISGDIREADMEGAAVDDEEAWEQYENMIEAGRCSGRFYRGDVPGTEGYGKVFYYLGD